MPRPRVTEAGAVLDAASRRLASHGIDATTVDDVAAEAGVSRATVYRYVGGKDEIVQAVIGREVDEMLAELAAVIASSATTHQAVADAAVSALAQIDRSAVLSRLSSADLRQSLPFITIDSPTLVGAVVPALASAIRAAPALTVDDDRVEDAVEELTRFVLLHLSTPRRDGSRLGPAEAGARAAALIAPLLEPRQDPVDRHERPVA